MKKIEIYNLTYGTEITFSITDKAELLKWLDYMDCEYIFGNVKNGRCILTTNYKLSNTEIKFLKGKVATERKKHFKTKPIYDYTIVCGITRNMEYIYKQIN